MKHITEVCNYKFTTLVSPIKNKTEAFEGGMSHTFFPKCIYELELDLTT